jgi:hypothetical protein
LLDLFDDDGVSLAPAVIGELYIEGDFTKTADSITLNTGTATGSVSDTHTINSTYYQVDEVAGTPGFDFEVNFTLDGEPGRIDIVGRYQGSVGHNVVINAWNYTLAQWDRFTAATRDFLSSTTDEEFVFDYDDLLGVPADYLSGTDSKIQIIHTSPGNTAHDFYLDYIAIFERGIEITTPGTFQVILPFTEGLSNYVTLDGAAGTMTIIKDGVYKALLTTSFSGTDEATFESHLFVNGTKQDNIGAKRRLGADGDVGSAAFSGLVNLEEDDVVDVRIASDVAGDYASPENINWSLVRVGP